MVQDTDNKSLAGQGSGTDQDKRVRLYLSENKVYLMMDCYVLRDEIDDIIDEVFDEMDELVIPEPPDEEELKQKILEAAEENPNVKSLVLMMGKQPGPSRNGRIRWKGPYFDKGFLKDDTGAVDYRRRAAQTSVKKGEMLGFLVPPRKGSDGIDVFGQPVPAPQPSPFKITAGTNVEMDDKQVAFYAMKSGRIRFVDRILYVDEVYHVEGDVDIETGHIDHNGAVVIDGDVLEGAEVKAEGTVEINGLLEASFVETKGDLIVKGGITRASAKQLQVAGSVNAKFILESNLQAGGDVIVEREIVNSTIKTRGSVITPGGRIVGGELTALKGFVVGQLGSRACVSSQITAGVDHALVKELMPLQKEVQKLRRRQVRDLKGPTDSMLAKKEYLTEQQIKELNYMLQEIANIQEKIWDLKREMKKRTIIAKRLGKEHVYVKQMLFNNTEIFMGKEKLRVDREYRGPVHVVLEDEKIVVR